jgi:hypothetical protein
MKNCCVFVSLFGVLCCLEACPSRPQTSVTIPPSHSYTQRVGWTPPPAEQGVYATLEATSETQHLVPDPELASLAQELARRVARDAQARTPSVRVIQAVSWRVGITDPLPVVLTVKGTAGHTDAEIVRGMREIVQSEHVTHLGYGRAVAGNDEIVVITATRRRLSLDDIARSVHLKTA